MWLVLSGNLCFTHSETSQHRLLQLSCVPTICTHVQLATVLFSITPIKQVFEHHTPLIQAFCLLHCIWGKSCSNSYWVILSHWYWKGLASRLDRLHLHLSTFVRWRHTQPHLFVPTGLWSCRKQTQALSAGEIMWLHAEICHWLGISSKKWCLLIAVKLLCGWACRRTSAGDQLREMYNQLSKDPKSLSNLDQDLPNYAQHSVPIFSLPMVMARAMTITHISSCQHLVATLFQHVCVLRLQLGRRSCSTGLDQCCCMASEHILDVYLPLCATSPVRLKHHSGTPLWNSAS